MADTEGNMEDTMIGGAAKADTRRIQGEADTRHMAAKADTWRTNGGHMGGQGLEARPKWTQCGQMPDKLQERSISRPALFFLRENPTVNCLGKNTKMRITWVALEALHSRNSLALAESSPEIMRSSWRTPWQASLKVLCQHLVVHKSL